MTNKEKRLMGTIPEKVDEFKVVFSKKYIWFFLGAFLLFEIAAIGMIFDPKFMRLGIFMFIYVSVLCLFVMLATFLFYVKVEGSMIKVRTRLGRKYEFSCSDIKKVVCSKRNSIKYGTVYYLDIVTELHRVSMEISAVGIDTLASYLLERYEAGEIKYTAISKSSKRMLIKYKNGDYLSKKTNY